MILFDHLTWVKKPPTTIKSWLCLSIRMHIFTGNIGNQAFVKILPVRKYRKPNLWSYKFPRIKFRNLHKHSHIYDLIISNKSLPLCSYFPPIPSLPSSRKKIMAGWVSDSCSKRCLPCAWHWCLPSPSHHVKIGSMDVVCLPFPVMVYDIVLPTVVIYIYI